MKFRVYNQRLAGFLLMSGFPMILTGFNENKPELNTFYFNNTERLQEAVEYYKQHKDEILDVMFPIK